uniref:Uncharacterized protein n=1 Tax=Oryza sativa subsp. japonica TaxID=39947 RepID=Q652Y4_ORYSJ|nr:hypothetical protein [Oryza sativa Japonica Group]BAD54204.1 hypothetical protein [Oryza sativa Japonica Group]
MGLAEFTRELSTVQWRRPLAGTTVEEDQARGGCDLRWEDAVCSERKGFCGGGVIALMNSAALGILRVIIGGGLSPALRLRKTRRGEDAICGGRMRGGGIIALMNSAASGIPRAIVWAGFPSSP